MTVAAALVSSLVFVGSTLAADFGITEFKLQTIRGTSEVEAPQHSGASSSPTNRMSRHTHRPAVTRGVDDDDSVHERNNQIWRGWNDHQLCTDTRSEDVVVTFARFAG